MPEKLLEQRVISCHQTFRISFQFSAEIIKERVMFDEMELTDFLVNALDLKIFSRCRFKTTNSKYATAFGLAGFLFREKERTL